MTLRTPLTADTWATEELAQTLVAHLVRYAGLADRPRAGRKLRLAAVAFCRAAWPHFADPGGRRAVEASERFADDPLAGADLRAAHRLARELYTHRRELTATTPPAVWHTDSSIHVREAAAEAATAASNPRAVGPRAIDRLIALAHYLVGGVDEPGQSLNSQRAFERTRHFPDLVRCLFGDPFRPVRFDPTWNTTAALGLARTIYEERAFDRLPILADALEDAGCGDPAVLGHCRRDATHARGCWVADGVLGRGVDWA
jgi:hypothetical protein